MKAVLLAAGLGTRLKPITNSVPKCLVPINGVPLLDIWLNKLLYNPRIDHIYINTHYLSGMVEHHLEKNWSHTVKITTWYEPSLLGTAGTISAHTDEFGEEDLLLIHADNLSMFSLPEFIQSFDTRPECTVMSMMLFYTDQPKQCGIVELNKSGIVTNMYEKVDSPPSNLANGAVYILSNKIVKEIRNKLYNDFSNQVIPNYFGKISSWINSDYHRDIGTQESLKKAIDDIPNPLTWEI